MIGKLSIIERAGIYKTLFLDSPDGMYVSTTDGRFVDVNASLCAMLGYARDELFALPVEAIYELPGERRRFVYEIESNGSVRSFHVRLKANGGSIVHCSVDAVVWRVEGGETGGYVGIIRRRSASGMVPAYAFGDERFSLAMRGSNDGLWEWDVRHKRAYFSPRWKSLVGYGNSEVGDSMEEWFSRIHPDDLPRFRESLARFLRREAPAFTSYHRMRHRDGHYNWMMARGVAEFMDTGSLSRIAGSLTDVSGHIDTIEKLKSQESTLSRRNEQLTREREMLSRYFPEELVQRICERSDSPLKGTLSRAAVIYLKIKDADAIMESLNAERFASFLNDFTTDILDLVYSHRGSVNRVLGDSILITFGCPVSSDNDITDCIGCALDIREYLKVFNDVRPDGIGKALELGMGIAYGSVFAGSIGSVRRMEYTILGGAVSRAEALMEQCSASEFDILIDSETPIVPGGSVTIAATRFKDSCTLVEAPARRQGCGTPGRGAASVTQAASTGPP